MAQSLKPSLWPLVTGIYPIPSAGSVYDDLVLFLHAFTPLITFGLICNSFRFACFVNSSLRFLIPNLHPICTCSCLFTPLTEGRSARDLTQAATSPVMFFLLHSRASDQALSVIEVQCARRIRDSKTLAKQETKTRQSNNHTQTPSTNNNKQGHGKCLEGETRGEKV